MDITALQNLLDDADVDYTVSDSTHGNAVVELPGQKRLRTYVLLIPQDFGFRVESFICRAVEQNREEVYRLLLQHNRRSFGVHYTLDRAGDIYLVGQFGESTAAEDIQIILGQILTLADGDFNTILEKGFEDSIRHEWLWRLTRGENTRNLDAFGHLKPTDDELSQATKAWEEKQAE